ncbi:cyclic AMP response element-binding protein A-like [Schistocerca americana]|uniref:cyclic AMP response element-binding protein A-like n=1 Tax=Schistocerca americana TaxID=7009 RepID=UPI001F4F37AE|nr:cyclic AMP response element-binding protein A-like [Schistocerca americana]XP_047121312.1 cyclic AMP response element-binding protein A-like [Schistocerca piceifrons]
METYPGDKSFYDVGVNDLKELWDSDLETGMDVFRDADDPDWGCGLLDARPHVVLYDRLMTDAALGAAGAPIKSEHSYSLASDGDHDHDHDAADADSPPDSPLSLDRVMDAMEGECWPLAAGSRRTSRPQPTSAGSASVSVGSPVLVKDEPLSEPPSPSDSCPLSPGSSDQDVDVDVDVDVDMEAEQEAEAEAEAEHVPQQATAAPAVRDHQQQQPQGAAVRREIKAEGVRTSGQQSVLKQPTILLATRGTIFAQQKMVIPKLNIKVEPNTSGFTLPPTPPSSTTSDSEGNASPGREPTSPGVGVACVGGRVQRSSSGSTTQQPRLLLAAPGRQPIQTPLISNQPKGSTGMLILTEEEKRTLLAEGYPIPTRLPLTKAEEKSLKKIRRKIKNKISAQESRRKKKEYMDALERKVEILQNENSDYKKKIETLEDSNASLLSQLQKLQAIVARGAAGTVASRAARNSDSSSFLTSHQHSSRSSMK